MILLIGIVCLCVFLHLCFFDHSWSSFEHKFCTIIVSVVLIAVCCAFGFGGATHTRTPDEPAALQAISTGTGSQGQFFLGSGGFGSEAKFYWYEKSGDSYTLEEADADVVTIIEQPGDPEVVYHTYDVDSRNWLTYPFHYHAHYYDTLTFYVPAGSVANNIDLSLPKE